MRILAVSDTHNSHHLLNEPLFNDLFINPVDMIIMAGDESTDKEVHQNKEELLEFLDWFRQLPIKYKIMIAGNHSIALARNKITAADLNFLGITYLKDSSVTVEGIKIYGSPWTPSYGIWEFMKQRGKLTPVWENIPQDTDILVTHGPPYGILDVTLSKSNNFEQVGDKELYNRIIKIPFLKYHIFGHIHNCKGVKNQGTKTIAEHNKCTFINASVVEDGKFGQLSSFGHIFEI